MNRLDEDDQFIYSYDNNGNMLSKVDKTTSATTTYQYDAENRLIMVTTPTDVVQYQYDGFGRRIAKTVNGTVTKFVYDGVNILFELDGNDQLKARYTHGPGIDRPISVDRDTTGDGVLDTTYYYHYDGLGSVTAMTDSAGNVVQTYTYDSFGNIVSQAGSVENSYTYTGREWDQEAQLYFYRARYYDPSIGRFISEDSGSGSLRNPSSLHRYVYVLNNPVNFVDPSGLVPRWMVPDKIIDNSQRAINNITNNAFNENELSQLTDLVIDTISSINPFAPATLADALKLGDINPLANPLSLTPDQAKSVDDIFESLKKENLSPEQRSLVDRAKEEYRKALKTGRCIIK